MLWRILTHLHNNEGSLLDEVEEIIYHIFMTLLAIDIYVNKIFKDICFLYDMSDIVLNMAENMIKYSNSYSLSKYDLVYESKPELFDFEQLEEYICMGE